MILRDRRAALRQAHAGAARLDRRRSRSSGPAWCSRCRARAWWRSRSAWRCWRRSAGGPGRCSTPAPRSWSSSARSWSRSIPADVRSQQGVNGFSSGRGNLITNGIKLFGRRPLYGFGSGSFTTEYSTSSQRPRRPSRTRTTSRSRSPPSRASSASCVYLALLVAALLTLFRGARGDPYRVGDRRRVRWPAGAHDALRGLPRGPRDLDTAGGRRGAGRGRARPTRPPRADSERRLRAVPEPQMQRLLFVKSRRASFIELDQRCWPSATRCTRSISRAASATRSSLIRELFRRRRGRRLVGLMAHLPADHARVAAAQAVTADRRRLRHRGRA